LTATAGLGQVHATQAQLNSMAQKCEETGQSLARGMAQLISRIEAMNNRSFAGSANAAFQDVSAQLNDGLSKILNALNELAGKMSDASRQFGAHDEDAAHEIRQAAASVHSGSVASILRG